MSKNHELHEALSGLVVTLSQDEKEAESALAAISAHDAITTEKLLGRYLPIAIEAVDTRHIHRWLESLAGVIYVDVVFCSTQPFSNPPEL